MFKRSAFTLIELLVVIAIIAILSAILFPVFVQAKSAAYKTQSMSSMRQVGTAFTLYVNDADDTSPTLYYYDANNLSLPTTQGFYYWPVLLLPYAKSEQIFLCPADKDDDPVLADSNGRGRFDPQNQLHHYVMGANTSYGYNYRYLATQVMSPDPNGTNPTPFHYVGKSLSAIGAPSTTVFCGEATMKDKARPGGGTITTTIGYARIEPPTRWVGTFPLGSAYGQLWPRFNRQLVNIAWADGHVKATALDSLRGPASNPDVWYSGLEQ